MGVLPSDSAGTPTSPAGTLTRPHCTLLTASAYHYSNLSSPLSLVFELAMPLEKSTTAVARITWLHRTPASTSFTKFHL